MKRDILWLAGAVIVVAIFGTSYLFTQQAQRDAANSPQTVMAADLARQLDASEKPSTVAEGHIDMDKSLAPFAIIYDLKGKVVGGSGYLNGKLPKAPLGILEASKTDKPYHAVTWQPSDSVRIAAVTVAARHYYVLSGRSLVQVEQDEDRTLGLTVFGCLITLAILAAAYQFAHRTPLKLR